jgi:hypothetical protein
VRVVAALAVSSAALALAASASAALFVTFEPAEADVGETVTIRLGGTPPDFTPGDRVPPFGRAITVFLVSDDEADLVRDRRDPRLTKVATIVPDENGRGVARFTVPDLPDGVYWPAYYVPGGARPSTSIFTSSEPTFFSGRLENVVPSYEGRVALTIGASGGTSWLLWLVPAVALLALVAGLAVIAGRRARSS